MGWRIYEIILSSEFTRDEKLSILQDIRNNINYITFDDIAVMLSVPIILELLRGCKK